MRDPAPVLNTDKMFAYELATPPDPIRRPYSAPPKQPHKIRDAQEERFRFEPEGPQWYQAAQGWRKALQPTPHTPEPKRLVLRTDKVLPYMLQTSSCKSVVSPTQRSCYRQVLGESVGELYSEVVEILGVATEQLRQGLYEDAVKSLDRAMQFKPDTPEGWVLVTKILCRRGKSYESMREYDSALTDARRCLEINPDCVSGYILAGTATQHMGKLKQAVKWFKQGLVVSPGHKHLKAKLERAQYLARVKRYGFFENVIGTF
eukprot:TRINITY_DN2224_c0_g1_i2.p1 TRINITY_DN2224_c0_g1~~TRINITY_DN2224_c0_g1_i2.p1  ORF type:complete len:261 (-),score=34.11 TRINITY_DN2224_c0_g1_i2:137-919(-)